MLRFKNITIQAVRALFSATKPGLQMEKINEMINHFTGIGIILILITTSLVIDILSLKMV